MAINIKKKTKLTPEERLIGKNTSFAVREAYNKLRTNLQFVLAPTKGKVVLVSSSVAAEGKSTTAANISLTIAAQTQYKVLLIDADMRKPTQHKIYSLENSHGLSRFLSGFETLAESMQVGVRPNLDIITSGQLPPNPSELLGSDAMKKLIEMMKEHYDFIIIDTPPINVVTDVLVMTSIASGVLFVTRYGSTTVDSMKKALDALEVAHAKTLGFVIVDKPNTENKKRYSYKYGGSYKYGYRSKSYEYGYGEYKSHDEKKLKEGNEDSEKGEASSKKKSK